MERLDRVVLDTSCILNLLSPHESCDEALLRLFQLATQGRVQLYITHVVETEVPWIDPAASDPQNRRFIRGRLAMFPVSQLSTSQVEALAGTVQQFLSILWPNADPNSNAYAHHRRDCEHLAALRATAGGAFVTRDDRLRRKAKERHPDLGVEVLDPAEAVQRVAPPQTGTAAFRQVVRPASEIDGDALSRLMEPIKSSYPHFDHWRRKTLSDPERQKYVAEINGDLAGVSVWQAKDDRIVKLSTFYVGDDYRGLGIGPHLLFHQLRLWVEKRFEKVYVTVSSERLHVLEFFLSYGFRIEGASMRRYKAGETEFILAKHLYYERVDDEQFDAFLARLSREVFNLPEVGHARDVNNWFMPLRSGTLQPRFEETGEIRGAEIMEPDCSPRLISLTALEEIIYPARLRLRGREAFMIPIRSEWADAMLEVPRSQGELFPNTDKLRLRTDNAYYCSPRYGSRRLTNSPVVFYVSQGDQIVAGFARILSCRTAEPEDLFAEFGTLGIYRLEDVRQHVEQRGTRYQGQSMALRFAWWVPFSTPITLRQLREEFGMSHPQTVTAIPYDAYECLLEAGGIIW